MNCKRVVFWHYQVYKCFCTGNVKHNVNREAKFLNKLLTKGQKNKKLFWQSDSTPAAPSTSGGSYKVSFANDPRRVTVLNKIFMGHVTDLMSSSEVTKDLMGKGFEITNVQVSRNYRHLNIYWFARSNLNEVEEILGKCAGILGHELSQMQVVGMVPKIHFIKNLHQYNVNRLDELLSQVDLSDDPEEQIDEKMQDREEEEEDDENENIYKIEVPTMKNDLFNVNYTAIMEKIGDELKKNALAKHRREQRLIEMANMDKIPQIEEFGSEKNKAQMMSQFLKKRALNVKKREIASLENLLEYKRMNEDAINTHEQEDEDDINEFPDYQKYQVQSIRDKR